MADTRTVTLTIEGREVTVPEGMSILEAAKTAGVLVPHYCYHPGLPVAGVCRMCLVEVEKAPKLAAACVTAVAAGQVVHVHSDKALEARQSVLEFLLINHPLDCPICDQSGECELQDYTFREGRAEGRLKEAKRFNPVEDFGGDVLYVPNRCILCTRCVRFMDDVAREPVLNVSERGDRAIIGKFEEHDLTHAWAGNVIDLCPVGALLSKDFLNKARAWELDRAPSVCPNCTQGCNSIIETRDNIVVRMRPRTNTDVNHYFMCDYGRLNYRWLNRRDRAANVKGAELFGFIRSESPLDLLEKDDVLVAAGDDLEGLDSGALARAGAILLIGAALPEAARAAAVVLPTCNMAEEEGTFTNLRGRVQRFMQAKAAPGMSRPSWWVVADLLAALGGNDSFYLASEVFQALALERSEFAGLSYDTLGTRGAVLAGAGLTVEAR